MATILTGEATHEVDVPVDTDAVLITPDDLREVTGWELKPEGLCRGGVCVPARGRDPRRGERIDLGVVAELLAQPIAIDDDTGTIALAGSPATRVEQFSSRALDDLVFRDVDGTPFAWESIGRRKKVVAAWASW